VKLAQSNLSRQLSKVEIFGGVFGHPVRYSPKLVARKWRTRFRRFFHQHGVVSGKMDGDCLCDALHEKRACLPAHQLAVQSLHQ
jgi:hypothetical protein